MTPTCPHGFLCRESCQKCWEAFAEVTHQEDRRNGGFLHSEQRKDRFLDRVLTALNNLTQELPT